MWIRAHWPFTVGPCVVGSFAKNGTGNSVVWWRQQQFPEHKAKPGKNFTAFEQLFCLLAAVQSRWAESGREALYQVCLKVVHEDLSFSRWGTCAVSFIKESNDGDPEIKVPVS